MRGLMEFPRPCMENIDAYTSTWMVNTLSRDKWPPFRRRHFEIHFKWKSYFTYLIFLSSPHGPINNKPALVQIIVWRLTGDEPLSEPMMAEFNAASMSSNRTYFSSYETNLTISTNLNFFAVSHTVDECVYMRGCVEFPRPCMENITACTFDK